MRALYRRQTIFETNNKTKNRARSMDPWIKNRIDECVSATYGSSSLTVRNTRASLHEYACVGERRVRECAKMCEIRRNECSTYNIRYIMYIVLYIRTNH